MSGKPSKIRLGCRLATILLYTILYNTMLLRSSSTDNIIYPHGVTLRPQTGFILKMGLPVEPISPTKTQDWLKCPTYGYLKKYWEPVGPWKPHLALGKALHIGLQAIFLRFSPDQAVSAVVDSLKANYKEQDEWSYKALETAALRGLRAATNSTVASILEHETILGVEPEIGNARVDLVTSRGTDLIVTDHKVKLQSRPEWIWRDLQGTAPSWQLMDYAWRVSTHPIENTEPQPLLAQENIAPFKPVTHIRTHLIVLTPQAKAYLHEVELDLKVLTAWYRGARQEWAYIHSMKDVALDDLPMRVTSCFGRYGKCEFYEACWSANRDPERMGSLYVERQTEETWALKS